MKIKNRWAILVASVIANLCIGACYSWSVFQKPLIDMFGFTTSEASLAYTISLCIVPFSIILSGKMQAFKGVRFTLGLGGIIFGAGLFFTGFTSGLASLYLLYGIFSGIGIGVVYGCVVPNTVRWFPDKRGLAGGVIAAGLGLGSVLFAPLSAYLIDTTDVLMTFRILGIALLIIIVVISLFVDSPPENYKPKGWDPVKLDNAASAINLRAGEMMKTSKFWILWGMYAVGCISGLMIIGHASPIGQEQMLITPEVAAGVVALIAIANTSGRLFWGMVSDRLGRYNTLILMYILTGVMLLMLSNTDSYLILVISVMGVGLSFGGYLGIFPSITADNFGPLNLGVNYGVIFTAFGLAAYIGPQLGAGIRESTGDYSMAFVIASFMSVAGVILTFYMKYISKKERRKA